MYVHVCGCVNISYMLCRRQPEGGDKRPGWELKKVFILEGLKGASEPYNSENIYLFPELSSH